MATSDRSKFKDHSCDVISNIRNDVTRMKCWIKQGVNQSNIKIVLNEPENVKQMTQCCRMGTYISLRHHTFAYV